jgi:streptogramin lyase
MEKPLQVFCCYAREDQHFLNQLNTRLIPMQREGLIIVESDINISPGEEWEQKITRFLNAAQIILLLVSPDFMASDYCYSKEMVRAMERHEQGEARVIPIILRPDPSWRQAPFGKLQALPTNGEPVTSRHWQGHDKAFFDVTLGIQKTVEELLGQADLPNKPTVFPDNTELRPYATVAGKPAKPNAWRRFVLLGLAGLVIVALASGIVWFTLRLAAPTRGIHAAPAGSITEFPVPTTSSDPAGITAGHDGNLWFTEFYGNKIGRVSPRGTLTEFPVPTAKSEPMWITTGPDGNLWFTEVIGNKIGRVTIAGSITEFPIPTAKSEPGAITAGSDGNLWFTEVIGNKIGRITIAGSITEFPVPTAKSYLGAITAGHDGNLWFTESSSNKIGRISPRGMLTEFPVSTDQVDPWGIAAGSDGNLWFTEFYGNKIGRITIAGSITEFPVPTAKSSPDHITSGPDGNLWFTEIDGNKIGRITTAGSVTEFPIPTAKSSPVIITTGPDGNLWFTEIDGNKIGRITSGK